jgi:hypothetical protein
VDDRVTLRLPTESCLVFRRSSTASSDADANLEAPALTGDLAGL